jgi:hypothetical protein
MELFGKILFLLMQGFNLYFSRGTMYVLHMFWLFACFSLVVKGQMTIWVSLNIPCGKGRD